MAESKNDNSQVKSELSFGGAITDEERELSNQATEYFEKKDYDACLKVLSKLSESRGPDPQVSLNVAIVNFHKTNQTQIDEFKKALLDAANKAQIKLENVQGIDDIDQCIFYFNYAILLAHLHNYRTALEIMERLVQYIEPMDENLSRRVLSFHMELLLRTDQPEKVVVPLTTLEKSIFGNGKAQTFSADKDKENKESNHENVSEHVRANLSLLKARYYLKLRSMKPLKREIKNLVSLVGMTSPSVYIKSNFEHLRGNHRKALKLLNTAPNPGKPTIDTGESIATMYYNNVGVIHFYMRKHNLGSFYLKKALQENEKVSQLFNLSGLANNKTLSGRPLSTLGISRHFELFYNIGIQLLHCRKPHEAFDCLIETVQMFKINPRLWLRLAECCIMVHKSNNDDDRKMAKRLEIVRGFVASGVHRKLILGKGLNSSSSEEDNTCDVPTKCLEFALLCLRNALVLLSEDALDINYEISDETEIKLQSEAITIPAPPSNPLKHAEIINLRCSILCASAYAALSLSEYVLAMEYASKLLKQPQISSGHKYLGNMYLAEAMLNNDRIADAISHLNPDNITDISMIPSSKQETEKIDKNGDKDSENDEARGSLSSWSPKDVTKAKAIMQYNLATGHALRGEYEKALRNLEISSQNIGFPHPAQITFLHIYLELMEGRRKKVQLIIKENFGHLTPNFG